MDVPLETRSTMRERAHEFQSRSGPWSVMHPFFTPPMRPFFAFVPDDRCAFAVKPLGGFGMPPILLSAIEHR
jgi:hypothetical protein